MPKIRFYQHSEGTSAYTDPPEPAVKFVPDWYKKQKGTVNDSETLPKGYSTSTVKRCMPVFDIMTAGYMITMPCDVYLDATDPEKLTWSIPIAIKQFQADMFSSHEKQQYDEYPIDKSRQHETLFRVMPFWYMKTEPGYSTLFLNPVHRDTYPLTAIPAFVDSDKFITEGHLSFIVEKGFKGVIKRGTPLVQVIPVKRDSWESEVVDAEDSKKTLSNQRLKLRSMFANGYKLIFRSKKEYN
jgi:hypothetical protein